MESSYQGGVADEEAGNNFQRLSQTIASNIKKISQNGMCFHCSYLRINFYLLFILYSFLVICLLLVIVYYARFVTLK